MIRCKNSLLFVFLSIVLISIPIYTKCIGLSLKNGITYIGASLKNHPILASAAMSATIAAASGLYYQFRYKPFAKAQAENDQSLLLAMRTAAQNSDFLLSVLTASTLDHAIQGMWSLSTTDRAVLQTLAHAYDNCLMDGLDHTTAAAHLVAHINSLITL